MLLKDDELVWFRFEHLTKSNPRHINEHNEIWVWPEAQEINFASEYSWLEDAPVSFVCVESNIYFCCQ